MDSIGRFRLDCDMASAAGGDHGIGIGNLQTNAMAGFEDITNRPNLDRVFIYDPGLARFKNTLTA